MRGLPALPDSARVTLRGTVQPESPVHAVQSRPPLSSGLDDQTDAVTQRRTLRGRSNDLAHAARDGFGGSPWSTGKTTVHPTGGFRTRPVHHLFVA